MGPVSALFVAAALLIVPPQDKRRAAELVRTVAANETTDTARQKAVAELKRFDPVVALALLGDEFERAGDAWRPNGFRPELDRTPEARAAKGIKELWDHHIWNEIDIVWLPVDADGVTIAMPATDDRRSELRRVAVGGVLVTLLKKQPSEPMRRHILQGLKRHYCPAAEAPLAAILKDVTATEQLTAGEILVERHPKRYAGILIDRVADPKRPAGSRHLYLSAFHGGPFTELDPADQRRLIRAGFALLLESKEYFTAGNLATYLGEQFTPSPSDPRYAGPNGLTPAYFTDTVANALAWWAKNSKKYE